MSTAKTPANGVSSAFLALHGRFLSFGGVKGKRTRPAIGLASFIVQIAAFSHPEDAKMFVSALHAKGYNVTAQVAADNLTHVQIGPFGNRKEAESMKQQLSADGYSAMIK